MGLTKNNKTATEQINNMSNINNQQVTNPLGRKSVNLPSAPPHSLKLVKRTPDQQENDDWKLAKQIQDEEDVTRQVKSL